MSSEVPEPLQAAAETVRRHLVALRGGAPFLSPSDAHQLLTWLEEGRGVGQILVAVERAATRRTRQRIRAPLSLTHARRYLKTAPAVAPVVATDSGTPRHTHVSTFLTLTGGVSRCVEGVDFNLGNHHF
ncbi:MAG: hypothetical protein ACON5B_05455, partial [Myxococcota bacterium]